jgi:hypothetical protein
LLLALYHWTRPRTRVEALEVCLQAPHNEVQKSIPGFIVVAVGQLIGDCATPPVPSLTSLTQGMAIRLRAGE